MLFACQTKYMPKSNHKTHKKGKSIVRKPKVSSSMGPTYDTKVIVTILLLLFIYPVGLIFMWAWMKSWSVWLKIVISLPLFISVFFASVIIFVIGNAVRHARDDGMNYQY